MAPKGKSIAAPKADPESPSEVSGPSAAMAGGPGPTSAAYSGTVVSGPTSAARWEWYDGAFRWPEKQHLRGPDNFEVWFQRVTLQMIAFGWEPGSQIAAKDDVRLAMHLSQIMESEPWLHVNHLRTGTEIIERLKASYRGDASVAKVEAIRELGQIRMRKSESVIDFQARFNDLARRVEAAGGHKDDDELTDLYLCGVIERFPWWVMAMRTLIRNNQLTLRDIQNSLFQEDRQRGNKREFPSKKANNSDSIIPQNAKGGKNRRKDDVCWDCGEKGHYRGSKKCQGPKEKGESESRDRPKGRSKERGRNRSKERGRNRSKERGRNRSKDRSGSHGAESHSSMPAHLSEFLDGHAYATSVKIGCEAMEGYKNLCAELEEKRPDGDYPKKDNLRRNHALGKRSARHKPPRRTPFAKRNLEGSSNASEDEDAGATESVLKSVRGGEARFLCHTDRKECKPKHHWLWDSGADCHIIGDLTWFKKAWDIPKARRIPIRTGGGLVYPSKIGYVAIAVRGPGNRPITIALTAVLYISNFPLCIMSGELFYLGGGKLKGSTLIGKDGAAIHELNIPRRGFYLWLADQKEPLRPRAAAAHTLHEETSEPSKVPPANTDPNLIKSRLWHRRLAHPGIEVLRKTASMVDGIDIKSTELAERPCDICDLTKSLRYRSGGNLPRADKALRILHLDSFQIKPAALSGIRWGALLTDDFSRMRWCVYSKNKGELGLAVRDRCAQLQNEYDSRIATLHMDGGAEFQPTELGKWAIPAGIRVELSAAYTPEENPVAETSNRIVFTKARALCSQGGLPWTLWDELVRTTVQIVNRCHTKAVQGKTPWQAFHDNIRPDKSPHIPNVAHFRTIGCKTFVNVSRMPETRANKATGEQVPYGFKKSEKLAPRAREGKLVGWTTDHSHQYRVWVPSISTVVVSPHVVFHEEYSDEGDTAAAGDGASNPAWEVIRTFPPWVDRLHGKRVSWLSVRDILETITETNYSQFPGLNRNSKGPTHIPVCLPSVRATSNETDPKSLEKALGSPYREEWWRAMMDELKTLISHGTFEFVEPASTNQRPIEGKWVFREKPGADGSVARRKARLVARGFTQREGIDYHETFASTASAAAVRILLAWAFYNRMEIVQGDVRAAYLNGEALQEEVYMWQVKGMKEYFLERPGIARKYGWREDKIMKVIRPLYGLKQSGRNWQLRFRREMKGLGFDSLVADNAVYRQTTTGALVISHVDDLLAIAANGQQIDSLKDGLDEKGIEVDWAPAGTEIWYLGIRISTNGDEGLRISQGSHIRKMVEGMPTRPAVTPMEPGAITHAVPREDMALPKDINKYQQMVGQAIYPSTRTRPDIALAAGIWARFMMNPSSPQQLSIERVFRYLQKYPDLGIRYDRQEPSHGNSLGLHAFVDSAYANQPHKNKSTTGWIFKMCGGAVSWASKRQAMVAQSSTEAEYHALNSAAREAAWIRNLLNEIGEELPPIRLYTDSQSCIRMAKNAGTLRTKHLGAVYHYIRQEIEAGRVGPIYVPRAENVADGLTKPLNGPEFRKFVGLLGMREE